ncbi:hypothetical protein KIW84_032541 [Lathyrus oleraceus]|uniref:Uncharacterized protein n=1 Tax=Pisum sativum TaxID=3888 RepID=A0A9D4XVK4_PEA|nr:hypothetical protein KIW84_032541 [Pisum sativum]
MIWKLTDSEDVEGFDDNKDEITIAITYRFDFTQPLNECNINSGLIYSSKKEMENDEYVNDVLDNSNPDELDDDKVVHQHPYAIKTLVDTHTCTRILKNRSANSKWVARAVVKKMQTQIDTVKIRDIMQDMRQHYFVGIVVTRAWKEELMAKILLR